MKKIAEIKEIMYKVIMIFFFLTGLNGVQATSPTPAEIDQSRIDALAWFVLNQNGDGSWGSNKKQSVRSTSEVLVALSNTGVKNGFLFNTAAAFLQNNKASSTDELARKILALQAAGLEIDFQINKLSEFKNSYNAWGAYAGFGSSLPDTPLAIMALLQANQFNASSISAMVCQGLLYGILGDSSFSYMVNGLNKPASQSLGAILPTAYALLALQMIQTDTDLASKSCTRIEGGSPVITVFTFSSMINNGITWLLGKQNADGGFGEAGVSSIFSTAVVYNAIKVLAPVTHQIELDNALGYLVDQQEVNGSWLENAFLTSLATQALPPLPDGSLLDTDGDGVPDEVELAIGFDPLVADRIGANGNGRGEASVNFADELNDGVKNLSYLDTLVVIGGVSPYSYSIVDGFLPDGLNLNPSDGAISGVPLTGGVFNFTYKVTDVNGNSGSSVAQILVREIDINFDGIVNLGDYIILQRAILGLVELSISQMGIADIAPAGGDGVVALNDLLFLQQLLLSTH